MVTNLKSIKNSTKLYLDVLTSFSDQNYINVCIKYSSQFNVRSKMFNKLNITNTPFYLKKTTDPLLFVCYLD